MSDDLDKLFRDDEPAEVDPAAKARALQAAMQAYREAAPEKNSQGFLSWWRPKRDRSTSSEENKMIKTPQPWLLGGVATLAFAVFAFILVGPRPDQLSLLSASDTQSQGEAIRIPDSVRAVDIPENKTDDAQPAVAQPATQKQISAAGEQTAAQVAGQAKAGPPQPAAAEPEVAVNGIRESLANTSPAKRSAGSSAPVVDAISAEDIGRFPDTSVSESLQRVPATSADRAKAGSQAKTLAAAPPPPVGANSAPPEENEEIMVTGVRAKPSLLKRMFSKKEKADASISVAPSAADDMRAPASMPEEDRDNFKNFEINTVKRVAEEPVSTFSIDVDTSSYSFVRRSLNRGVLPPKDAVRVEEMINYFDYDYALPESKKVPFEPNVLVMDSPWAKGKKLVHIGIKGYDIPASAKPRSHLTFLLDVSGSMESPDKLPLVKQSMSMLLNSLDPKDTVAIAVYAGAAGTVLEPTAVKDKQKILDALGRLQAGGSTAGAEGIRLAYQLAASSYEKNAVNRIILATDGDFNVGITSEDKLKGFVERQRERGIYLTVLGFGEGNYQDALMQTLAQNGNGAAAYIDTLSEAQKVLVDEASSTLFPIAKDVKIQVEFNPAKVSEYRLIGYETRALKREDFNNDKVDAGEIGSGHAVTAIYEITPAGSEAAMVDELRYGSKTANRKAGGGEIAKDANTQLEYGYLKIRYKLPNATRSQLLQVPIAVDNAGNPHANDKTRAREARFASAVAGFAQLLKDPRYLDGWSYEDALKLAQANKGDDNFGYRTEFVQLIRKAMSAAAM